MCASPLFWCCAALLLFCSACGVCGVRQSLKEFDVDVQDIVNRMSLPQKLGQMGQLSFNAFFNNHTKDAVIVNDAPFIENLDTYFTGSLLDTPTAGWDVNLTNAVNLTGWRTIVTKIQDIAKAHGSKLPIIIGLDLVHGAHYVAGSTIFPHQINCAATFNVTHARNMGEVTARNGRAIGVRWVFNPIGDLALQPAWSRTFEQFGEDPLLASRMIAETVYGLQGQPANIKNGTKLAACMKHFLGYGNPRNGHDIGSSWIPERYLQMYFLPAFDAAVRAGVATAMESFNDINGVPVGSSRQYLVNVLREQLGFDGVLVTDWQEINLLYTDHHVAQSPADAVKLFLMETSIDMDMIPIDNTFNNHSFNLVTAGHIPQERIDLSTARIIQLKKDLGLLDDPYPPPADDPVVTSFGSEADEQASLQAARESLVLVKNNHTLPLSNTSRVLLVGPGCNSRVMQTGGWSLHWQGPHDDGEFWSGSTLLTAIRTHFPQVHVTQLNVFSFVSAFFVDYDQVALNGTELDMALAEAANVDTIIACVGETRYAEAPGNTDNLELAPNQQLVLRRLSATGRPLVMVLLEGRPRVLNGTAQLAESVIYAMLPGPHGGQALAELLFGAFSPSGRLPISYPKAVSNALNPYWRSFINNADYRPEWMFGHGLSYTKFEYSNLRMWPHTLSEAEPQLSVWVDVTNTGSMASAHSILVFTQQTYRIISPEVRVLKAFDKIFLVPGEKKTVRFNITVDQLAFYGLINEKRWQNGELLLIVGAEDDVEHAESAFTLNMRNPTPCPFKVVEHHSEPRHIGYTVLPVPGHVVTSMSYKQSLGGRSYPMVLQDGSQYPGQGSYYTAEPRAELSTPFYLLINERGMQITVPITFFSDKALHAQCY